MIGGHAVDDLLHLVGSSDETDVALGRGDQGVRGLSGLGHQLRLVDVLELLETADGCQSGLVADHGEDHPGLPGELAFADDDGLDIDLVAGELTHYPLHDAEFVLDDE